VEIPFELRFVERSSLDWFDVALGDDGFDVAVEFHASGFRFGGELSFDLGLEFEVDHAGLRISLGVWGWEAVRA
jgi:hypothetical protein